MRALRVAELIQAEQVDVERAAAAVPAAIKTHTAQLASGTLLTLEYYRPWWDRRPRSAVLHLLQQRLGRIVDETGRVMIVGAAIERDGLVLAAQRAHPPALKGKWEFPGGKIELGESPATALVRECDEELGVRITAGTELGRLDLETGAVLIILRAVLTDPAQEPENREHLQVRWCSAAELTGLDWLDTNAGFAVQLGSNAR
jgi:8-oxo-dGTP diphosphatase